MATWMLEDASEIAQKYPYTFFKSSAESIAKVVPGELVKLIFQFESEDPEDPRAERMWVLVDEIMPDGSFKGKLDNQPYYIQDLKYGDPLHFQAHHIINTQHDDGGNLVEKYLQRCFVTRRVLNEGYPVGYLYREETEEEADSGWRVLSNTEDDEYMNNPENSAYVSLGAVLNEDDSILVLLDSPIGARFVRDLESGAYIEDSGD